MTSTTDEEVVHTTCPRDCYDACGIRVTRLGGAIARVGGDPAHPWNRGSLCGKCTLGYNGVWRDEAARLVRPLVRAGAKGAGQFRPVDWDEALGLIAGRVGDVLATAGGRTVVHTHYTGTCSLLAYWFPLRFFNRIGATEVDPDTVCNKAGHIALQMTLGTSLDGFDPRTARDADCVLVWGANPSATAPHIHRNWLGEFRGAVIAIDPVRHPTAEAADLHLQPFPGSDAALAFAMLHVIAREGMVDEGFLAAHAIGWDEVRPLLPACTPAWGEASTGVPAGLIEEAARAYGRGRSLLWLGQGLQRQPNGGNVFRACCLLPAATGNLGRPGTGLLYLNGAGGRGVDVDYLAAPHLNPGPPSSISHMDLAARLEDPTASRVLFCWNNNIVASSPSQNRLRAALAREGLFTVAIDLFPTDTTAYADVVLPAASFLEFDDLVLSYFHYTVSAQVKAAEPVGDALPNQEIFRRLARRMGFAEPELYEPDDVMLATLLKQTGLPYDFAALARTGTVDYTADPIIPFAGGKFPTPSGKIELASGRFTEAGLPRVPQPWADPRPGGGRLRVLSPASPWLLNSGFGNDPRVRAQFGPSNVLLHPAEAAARGLAPGAKVVMVNECGRLPLTLALSDIVPPGVALVYKGRWPKLDPSGANVNVLHAGRKTDLAESSAVHAVEAELIGNAI